jgi:hypothetical protein
VEGATREQLEEAVRRKIARPVYAVLVGDHLTGIAAQSTAYSLAGGMLVKARQLLGLRPVSDVKERQVEVAGWPALLRFLEMKAALDSLATTRNTVVLEEIHSPHVVLDGPELEHLKKVGRSFITRSAYHDVVARAAPHREAAGFEGKLADGLEAARLYLFGTHLLASGECVSHLDVLAPPGRLAWLDDLRQRQRAEGRSAVITRPEAKVLKSELEGLETRLGMALASSALPETGGSITSLDDFLIELRLKELRGEES